MVGRLVGSVGPRGALFAIGCRVSAMFALGLGAITALAAPAPAAAQTITEYAVPTAGSAPTGIAAGPDGALWFTELSGNKIGRMTPDGVVTDEFTVPTASSSSVGIAAGPDGALWFAERNGNNIGRITTAGVITEFAVPTASSQPTGIAVGPDGAL
jgi:virginiamycin B lyase